MRTRRSTALVILAGIVGALWLATPAHADMFTATATPATVTLTPRRNTYRSEIAAKRIAPFQDAVTAVLAAL